MRIEVFMHGSKVVLLHHHGIILGQAMSQASAHVDGPFIEQTPDRFARAGDLFGSNGGPLFRFRGDSRKLPKRVERYPLHGENIIPTTGKNSDFVTRRDPFSIACKPGYPYGRRPNLQNVIHHGTADDQPVFSSKNGGFNGRTASRKGHVNTVITHHGTDPSVNAGHQFPARPVFHGPQFMPTVVRQEGCVGHDGWNADVLLKAPLQRPFDAHPIACLWLV